MLKKTILTYYAVWYMAHKNSKYADDFGYFWYSALLMVGESFGALLLTVFLMISSFLGFYDVPQYMFFGLFFLPFLIMYYIIFKKYGISKEAEDESFDYLKITKKKIIFSWCFFIGINALWIATGPYLKKLY